MSTDGKDEVEGILARAKSAGVDSRIYGIHLLSRVSVLNYVRIADEIRAMLPNGRILDWGCSYGQMSFLLKERGLNVESYDLGAPNESGPSVLFPEVHILRGSDPVRIPYPGGNFDAVLSCGVLEHVADEDGSLAEIHRILRRGGLFFIYNLPQRGSLKEAVIGKLKLGYVHERQYTLASASDALRRAGFNVVRAKRSSLLPQNLSPFPRWRGAYNRLAYPLSSLDRALSRIPLLGHVAEALELIAVKRGE